MNDSLNVIGAINSTSIVSSGAISGTSGTFTSSVSGTTITGTSSIQGTNLILTGSEGIQFEGSSADDFETVLVVENPTADRTITLPNITGTVITTGDTGTITSTMIANNTIVNEDIANATIRGAKLNTALDTVSFATVNASNFNGVASIATTVSLAANNSNNETVYLTFSDTATGNRSLETDTDLSYNPSTNVLSTTATKAQYADLAEIYSTDKLYDVGTVVVVGGEKEVTQCSVGKRVLGVISDRPAFLMNSNAEGQPIALKGRVKVKVVGLVKKGDELVASNDGFATSITDELTKVFAISLEDNKNGVVEAVIL